MDKIFWHFSDGRGWLPSGFFFLLTHTPSHNDTVVMHLWAVWLSAGAAAAAGALPVGVPVCGHGIAVHHGRQSGVDSSCWRPRAQLRWQRRRCSQRRCYCSIDALPSSWRQRLWRRRRHSLAHRTVIQLHLACIRNFELCTVEGYIGQS